MTELGLTVWLALYWFIFSANSLRVLAGFFIASLLRHWLIKWGAVTARDYMRYALASLLFAYVFVMLPAADGKDTSFTTIAWLSGTLIGLIVVRVRHLRGDRQDTAPFPRERT